ncbi:MAG: putative zinc-binding protein [Methanobrevibacter sp.]|uniref:putative zinc-binding protein n=1 Tax=uncultured Methanobrevibacter sp. TaxID=253161 RepID=UPI0025E9D2FF|nr:putative zinc-binding protein [uncultured Methanobrevibacter sp.]MEE1129422.1 putative zinc-binding protein [Methanobrevibacter sp.]
MGEKVALAPCNGMSANGLVSRVAVGDCKKENENAISICMGSTSADIEGNNNEMLKKFPIIAVNGCPNGCVNKILENKGIYVAETVAVNEILEDFEVSAKDPFRLDGEAEECVKIIKEELIKSIEKLLLE